VSRTPASQQIASAVARSTGVGRVAAQVGPDLLPREQVLLVEERAHPEVDVELDRARALAVLPWTSCISHTYQSNHHHA